MKNIFFTLFLLAFTHIISAQFMCGDQIIKNHFEEKYPGVTELINTTFKNAQSATNSRNGVVYKIPVVVHVVYNNNEQNISDELVQEQIDILNEDFRRLNASASETRDIFADVAGDAEIEFYLATEDPEGSETNGITRTFTNNASFLELDLTSILEAITDCGFDILNPENNSQEAIDCFNEALGGSGVDGGLGLDNVKFEAEGGKNAWDVKKYLNIWVCNLAIDFGGMSLPSILGFAYPPVEAPNWPAGTVPPNTDEVDGVVIHYQAWGKNNPASGPLAGIADLGKTATHEVGHYLGLRHIWGDGDCTMDDGISDTPAAGSNSQPQADIPPCSQLHVKDSCLEDDLPDMIENYMDYSVESCQNMFTLEQIAIMRAMLEGPRSELVQFETSTKDIDNSWFSVSPNPSSTFVNIITDKQNYSVSIFNMNGVKVFQGQNIKTVDSTNFPEGLYIMNIESNDALGSIKYIKTK